MLELIKPIINNKADCVKGNRLFTGKAYKKIPKTRYFGNAILSLFTKIASGYWHIADSQCGYISINRKILDTLNWDDLHKGFAEINDLIINLNIYDFKIIDVPVSPIYSIGEKSNLRIRNVIFSISFLLLKGFLKRLYIKYVIRDFHPLVLFYFFGILFFLTTFILSIRLIIYWIITGYIRPINAMANLFFGISGLQLILFAMWFDMDYNRKR